MRKVRYGVFQDHYIDTRDYDPNYMMIGQQAAINKQNREYAATRGYEYYIKDSKGRITILKKVTKLEAMIARFLNKLKGEEADFLVAGRNACKIEILDSKETTNTFDKKEVILPTMDKQDMNLQAEEKEKKLFNLIQEDIAKEDAQRKADFIKEQDTINRDANSPILSPEEDAQAQEVFKLIEEEIAKEEEKGKTR